MGATGWPGLGPAGAAAACRRLGRGLGVAVRCLTVIPWPAEATGAAGGPPSCSDLAVGAWAFPLVGAAVGLAGAAGVAAGAALAGPLAGAALGLLGAALLTGGLHWDGVADTADGLWSGLPRKAALEVMRDPRLGALGGLGLGLGLLLTCGLWAAAAGPRAWLLLPAAGAAGRAAIVLAGWRHRYARTGPGMGAGLAGLVSGRQAAAAAGLAAAVAAPAGAGGLLSLAAALAAGALLARWVAGRLGGLTGDGYGFLNQAVEAVYLVAYLGLARMG